MALPQDATGSLSPAESLLVEFLGGENPTPEEFDAFCARHAEEASELRRLYKEWSHLDRLLGARATDDDATPTPLEIGSQPGVTLDPFPRKRHQVFARLRGRGTGDERYERQAEIARGGMGVVYRVWDPELRRDLAMKVVRSARGPWLGALETDPDQERLLARFLAEAQITGQLEHPSIVPVHELGVDDRGNAYFTMPLVRGRELKEIIPLARRGLEGWDLSRAVRVIVRVCEAVAYAHSKGVVHRDLKPSNVMVGRFGVTYVMDWGLARVAGERADATAASGAAAGAAADDSRSGSGSPELTGDGQVVGTPAYMAPEQASQASSVGPRADVYAIGSILYHLLTGRMPYGGGSGAKTPQSVLAKLLQGPPAPVRELDPSAPSELVAVCEHAMEADPSKRYPSALDVARDLEAWLGHRPVSAYEPTPGYAARLALRRHRPVAVTAVAAVVLLFAWALLDVTRSRSFAQAEREARGAAEVSLARAELFADAGFARWLAAEREALWPATPEVAPRMAAWLERLDELETRGDRYESAAGWMNAPEDERRGRDEVAARLPDLRAARPGVEERLERARTLVARTVDERRAEWDGAIASISMLPAYGGLVVEPQPGLVPWRLAPESGLWEFWVDGTGEPPTLDDDGWPVVRAEDAVVLVLVPGGRRWIGSPDEAGREPYEVFHEVDLGPFLLGKYELTQAQWMRAMEGNPARYKSTPDCDDDPRHPVESVCWDDCAEYVRRTDLRLPREVEWEFAARFGDGPRTVYATGDDPATLEGFENVRDQSAEGQGEHPLAPWNDGYVVHAPVGSFRPSAGGFHDLHGNVSEWCADWFRPDLRDERPSIYRLRVFRGGSSYLGLSYDRLAFRQRDEPGGRNYTRGLRVARDLR